MADAYTHLFINGRLAITVNDQGAQVPMFQRGAIQETTPPQRRWRALCIRPPFRRHAGKALFIGWRRRR